jgi:tetratricopeptide (TPR) repeat protein
LLFGIYRGLAEACNQQGAYAQAITYYEGFLALFPQLDLDEAWKKSHRIIMKHYIQSAQEKLNKETLKKEPPKGETARK